MLEVYKCLKNENPSFMRNMFQEKSIQYNLRLKNLLMLLQTNTIKYGNDSIVFRGSILWNYLPNETKSQTSVCSFKKRIKNWSGVEWTAIVKFVNSETVIYIVYIFLKIYFRVCK